jgi:hypothetical protein
VETVPISTAQHITVRQGKAHAKSLARTAAAAGAKRVVDDDDERCVFECQKESEIFTHPF